MFQTSIIITFTLFVIVYLLINQKHIHKFDLSLLLISVIALSWKQLSYKSFRLEKYQDTPDSLASLLTDLKPIQDEEDFSPIAKNLIMYYTSYSSLSYTYGTKIWRNVIDTTETKSGQLQCNTSMYFDLLPSFSKIAGFTLGPNGLTGPYSNTLGINYRGQFSFMLVFKHGNLKNDATETNKIELLKLWANSPNNNGLSLYIEPGSLQITNNTQFGKLMFQYADYSPVHCKISATDELIPIESNVLCFLFIVKDSDKVRVLYMTEKSNSINTLAEFNVANTDITFSNKELSINRFHNWNANILNFAIYGTSLTDVSMSSIYQHIKNLYLKTTDPNYKPIVDTYNDAINKLTKYLNCSFDEKTCNACKDVKQWNDISQVMNAPFECRKAISAFCKKNPKHSFCTCWDTKSSEYNSNNCKVLRTFFENDKVTCMTDNDVAEMTQQCNMKADTSTGIAYDSGYTFDKVRVKYDDSLTTQEKLQLGKDVSKPDFMIAGDYQAALTQSALRVTDDKSSKDNTYETDKTSTNTTSDLNINPSASQLPEDELLMKELIKTEEDLKLSKKTNGGIWSFLNLFK